MYVFELTNYVIISYVIERASNYSCIYYAIDMPFINVDFENGSPYMLCQVNIWYNAVPPIIFIGRVIAVNIWRCGRAF